MDDAIEHVRRFIPDVHIFSTASPDTPTDALLNELANHGSPGRRSPDRIRYGVVAGHSTDIASTDVSAWQIAHPEGQLQQ